MQYRDFCGVDISEVGLGTWQLGSADWGDVDEAEALDILRRSVELGVNFLDTADVYGMGHSERMLGRFLNESNGDVRVATKLGRRHDDPNGWPQNFTEESMRQHTENSLRNMKLETVFLTQLHCIPAEELQRGEVFENLRGQQSAGLIEHWGGKRRNSGGGYAMLGAGGIGKSSGNLQCVPSKASKRTPSQGP